MVRTTQVSVIVPLSFLTVLLVACGGSSSSLPPDDTALERIPHSECVAPATPHGEVGALGLEAAFPNLPAMSWILGLHQAPGDNEFWYAVLRDGDVVRFANDPAASALENFLSLDNVRTNFEMGFLGLAFHPDYQDNGQVFVSYNDQNALGRTTISRLSLNGGSVIDMSTEEPLLTVNQPADNHNGGQIHFGPDGFLYISLGDGGANATESQNTGTLLGALLRIDVDRVEPPRNYVIPADNPFVDDPEFALEIYAYGLRNPWRWSFDQLTSELWLADVGLSAWEEVNVVQAGDNFGWPIMEGDQCFAGGDNCDTTGLKLPRLQYAHGDGSCSITGGFVYRGSAIPALAGDYIFSDWCTGFVWRAFNETGNWEREQIADAWFNVPAFGQGHDGEIYVLNPSGGPGQGIFRLAPISEAGESTANIPTHLSDTGCYESTADKEFAPFVAPYGIHSEQWADGANIRRGFAIPDGTTITLEADGAFNLPVGSVLIQELLNGDQTLETRLFMHHQNGWAGYSYEWLPDGTDAVLLDEGKSVDTGNFVHTFPSPSECQACHAVGAGVSLGLETSQLNRRQFTYPATGRQAHQLNALFDAGFLSDDPTVIAHAEMAPLDDESASVTVRARSYLHSNCSGCHRPGSTAPAMDIRVHTALADTGACNAETSNPMGLVDPRIIRPGDAERSTLLARMLTLNGPRMPPVASKRVDAGAAALIAEWINSLENCL